MTRRFRVYICRSRDTSERSRQTVLVQYCHLASILDMMQEERK